MSNNLSIEEIIKRAEQIRAQADEKLREAETGLGRKALSVSDKIALEEKAAAEKLAKILSEPEEDIKEFVPSAKAAPEIEEPDAEKEAPPVHTDGKTRNIALSADEEKTRAFSAAAAEERTRKRSIVASPEKSGDENELQGIPTIVARDEAVNAFSKDGAPEEDEGVQIRLEGFDDKIDTVEKIDEAQAEAELLVRREEKVGKFRLFGPDETDEELGENFDEEDDFDGGDEKDEFLEGLREKKGALLIKLIASVVLFIPMLLMAAFKDSSRFPLLTHGVFFSIMLVLYAAELVINRNVLKKGFRFKHSVSFDFPISVVSLIILVHSALLLFNGSLWIDNGVALAPVGAFSLIMSQLAKYNSLRCIIDNFKFITNSAGKYTVENITNEVDAKIISRGLIEEEEPRLKMSVKCDLPTNFMEISTKREPVDKSSLRIFLVSALMSIALFIAVAILDNVNTAFNCALCALAISLPVSALYISSSMLSDISNQLSAYDSRVCGFEGAFMAQNADALVMEAADLFDKTSCELYGIKTFGDTKIDDALINAAAVMIQTKSPLSHVFDEVIIGKQKILPKVDNVQYEERMGTSGWIYKHKVLVGTREMMQRHDVEVPLQSFEDKYTIKDSKALYLALDGSLKAMFVVSYSANPNLKRELGKLEKSGITLIVKSQDPYINEESLSALFSVPQGFLRVMNYSAARVYDKYSNLDVEKSPAYVVHTGSALGLVSAMRGAGILVGSTGLVSFLSSFGSAIGFLVVAMLSLIKAYGELSAVNILIFEAIWTAFMFIVTKLRGTGL